MRRPYWSAAVTDTSFFGMIILQHPLHLTLALVAACCVTAACARSPSPAPAAHPADASLAAAPAPAAQYPSPMVEETRAHGRLAPHALASRRVLLDGILPRPVELHLPEHSDPAHPVSVLVHFLGPAFIAVDAAHALDSTMAVAVVNLGAGSSAYERPFRTPVTWRRLLAAIDSAIGAAAAAPVPIRSIYLTAFSAGNGAVRAILADSAAAAMVHGAVILDGIHTGYVPDRRVVADGGRVDPANLQSLLRYARRAVRGEVRLLVSHSEIFPGTYASTTETASWLLTELGVPRTAVLAWGPNGMQQTSEARAGGFTLLGFAGNSAPDHVDHLHALPTWLGRIVVVGRSP